ncbi:uncharacterized protein LOC6524751 [Drosophila yakuba]|uniref:Uncharacterized protein n=1 Tax=Drosophila yakuba TaxID=7245 RepID=B4PW72_DROYA|nr:uncharacterized protein LOC6524751 [Drosophila yakuba]EDX01703.1 uncharacterized protein Dyak_GE17156 [Drosophila yakuba]
MEVQVEQLPIAVEDHEILGDQKMLPSDKPDLQMKHQSEIQKQKDQQQDVGSQLPPRHLNDAASQSTQLRPSRVTPPMPSEETMRHSIADNLMEILVNMTNPQHRQRCFSLLQVGDALQARSRILAVLQQIDERRTTRR